MGWFDYTTSFAIVARLRCDMDRAILSNRGDDVMMLTETKSQGRIGTFYFTFGHESFDVESVGDALGLFEFFIRFHTPQFKRPYASWGNEGQSEFGDNSGTWVSFYKKIVSGERPIENFFDGYTVEVVHASFGSRFGQKAIGISFYKKDEHGQMQPWDQAEALYRSYRPDVSFHTGEITLAVELSFHEGKKPAPADMACLRRTVAMVLEQYFCIPRDWVDRLDTSFSCRSNVEIDGVCAFIDVKNHGPKEKTVIVTITLSPKNDLKTLGLINMRPIANAMRALSAMIM